LLSTLKSVFEIRTDQVDFRKHVINNNNSEIEKVIISLGNKFIDLIYSNKKLEATQLLIRELEKIDASFTLKECSDYLKSNYFLK
jgi:phosphopantetheinyl transferase (holo-ACP synthase)